MAKTFVPRTLGTIDYQAGQRKTLEIDRDGVLMELFCRVQFTVTNSATPPVAPKFQALARIMRRFEVMVAGQDNTVITSGALLAARAQYEYGAIPYGMADTVVLTGSAVTVYDIVIPIALWVPRGRRPDDAALDLRRGDISQAHIAITWGDETDLFGTPNAAAISAVTCTIEAHYMLDVPADQQFLIRELSDQRQEVTGTNTGLPIILDRGANLAYRSLMLVTTADDVGNDSILNSATLKSGSFTFQSRNGVIMKGVNKMAFNQEALLTGVYFMDALKFGEAAHAYNTGILTGDIKYVLDVTKQTGTNYVDVSREILRPLNIG